MKTTFKTLAMIAMITVWSSCKKEPPSCKTNDGIAKVSIFATGLYNPRGLHFGPDGHLYVAEAGVGGKDSSVHICPQLQVPFPVGPYVGSPTGSRISRINSNGTRSTVTDRLPSTKGNDMVGGEIQGVADVAFMGNTLYGLLAGAGCSHGVPSVPNGIVKFAANGTWTVFADLGAWFVSHPVANPAPGDFEPEGTPYSMVRVGNDFYVMEPNHGDFVKVSANGVISRVVDISASQGHIVPTAVVYNQGSFFVGNLNTFPIVDGSSKILRISTSGQIQEIATGFTTILGLAFDNQDRLYVLENTTGNPFPTPGTGKITRINCDGSRETIAAELSLPTAMTFGPDKKLYVSNIGFGPMAKGGGQILKIDVKQCKCNDGPSNHYHK